MTAITAGSPRDLYFFSPPRVSYVSTFFRKFFSGITPAGRPLVSSRPPPPAKVDQVSLGFVVTDLANTCVRGCNRTFDFFDRTLAVSPAECTGTLHYCVMPSTTFPRLSFARYTYRSERSKLFAFSSTRPPTRVSPPRVTFRPLLDTYHTAHIHTFVRSIPLSWHFVSVLALLVSRSYSPFPVMSNTCVYTTDSGGGGERLISGRSLRRYRQRFLNSIELLPFFISAS